MIGLLVSIILTTFLESFGLAMLLPTIETVMNEQSSSQLSARLWSLINKIIPSPSIIGLSVFLFIIFIIKNSFKLLTGLLSVIINYRIRMDWMMKINHYYLERPYGDIIKIKQGVLINNLVHETSKASSGVLKINQFIQNAFMLLAYFMLMVISSPQGTIIVSLIGGTIILAYAKMSKSYLMELGNREINLSQKTNSLSAETISAMRQIRTFSIEKKVSRHLSDILKGLVSIGVKHEFIKSIPGPILEILIVGIIVGLMVISSLNGTGLQTSLLPGLIVFVMSAQRFMGQATSFLSIKNSIDYFDPAFRLIHGLLSEGEKNRPSTKKLPKEVSAFEALKDDIVFKNVSFGYNGEQNLVLNAASFTIPKGKITAITGPSGSGKSTIVDLILGLYQPLSGDIKVNGISMSQLDLKEWRKRIGFVSQDNYLFHDTIENNIRIGNLSVSNKKLIDCAKRGRAHGFIMDLPNGYDTIVGDRGITLSGGQRQRISIVRAMVREPEVYVFDEATSALDQETETEILEDIRDLFMDKTVIVISHRLSTIAYAKRILRLENGCVHNISTSIDK